MQGFKTYTHTNLALVATQVMKEDIALQVGSAAESVTVTAEATLLATETGELTHNVTLSQMDNLPLLGDRASPVPAPPASAIHSTWCSRFRAGREYLRPRL